MRVRFSIDGRRALRVLVWLLASLSLALAACGGDENLFDNPSFEEAAEPWFSLDTEAWGKPFSVSQNRAHSGTNSALLELRSEEEATTRVFGVAQEITPEEFPELLSGYYYVDRWEKGTPKQYLQLAVIVWEASNIPPGAAPANNHQVRYILAGVETQPTSISNSRYVMVTQDEPKIGEWVHFEANLRQDFEELWGAVPEGFTKLRIIFEVRWDDRQASDGPAAADVYYDDLYIGPPPVRIPSRSESPLNSPAP